MKPLNLSTAMQRATGTDRLVHVTDTVDGRDYLLRVEDNGDCYQAFLVAGEWHDPEYNHIWHNDIRDAQCSLVSRKRAEKLLRGTER
jgi:hypothetical protein